MSRNTSITAAVLCALLLGGCAYPAGSRDYRGYQVMGEQSVRFGVVESVRDVRINPGQTGVGTVGGAALGGILGSNVEHSANDRPGLEVTVLLDSGKYVAIVQEPDEAFRQGDRVRVVSGHGTTRVTH
ncbi:MAG TPA: hypothetical protein VFJ62_17820 [Usitatibacter sp.]|nr:hypothetical protein [Usitatibacter sp.]